MRAFLTLWRREMAAYFLSPIAYVVVMFFLFVMGYSFWLLTNVLSQGAFGVTVMGELFGSIFFWLSLLIVVPVTTMRLFAEEKRSGTIETLMTAPVSDSSVVLAKYAGALGFFMVMWSPTIAYVFILRWFDPMMTIDYGPILTSYIGVFFVGSFYLSIGLFSSSLTRNQIVAAIMCFALICVAFVSGFMPYISRSETVRDVGSYFSSVMHMLDFSRGVVDSRAIIFYLSGTALMLFATIKILESRKWK